MDNLAPDADGMEQIGNLINNPFSRNLKGPPLEVFNSSNPERKHYLIVLKLSNSMCRL
jgi:hypothetical protein